MKSKIVSALIGVAIGLPLSVAAAEARPEPAYYVAPDTSYRVDLSEIPDTSTEDIAGEIEQADLQLLACLVQAEAGNQDFTGKRLVVDVVLNRVADPRFPDTIAGVIYQPGQFSPVRNGALASAYYTVTDECFQAVALELVDQIDYDIIYFTGGGYGCGKPAFKYQDHYFSKEVNHENYSNF